VLCDKVCQRLAGWWFCQVSSTNKTDRHDITEILLKVALNTINLNQTNPSIRLTTVLLPACINSILMLTNQTFCLISEWRNRLQTDESLFDIGCQWFSI
jgi:hypothetical protein